MSEKIAEDIMAKAKAAVEDLDRTATWGADDHGMHHDLATLIVAEAIVAERERCAKICEAQKEGFLSPEYASNQPLGSLPERFACDECAQSIRGEEP